MNPLMIELLVAERSEEIRREVQRLHLIAQYEAHRSGADSRPALWTRFSVALGELLIRLGERIKSRYANKIGYLSDR